MGLLGRKIIGEGLGEAGTVAMQAGREDLAARQNYASQRQNYASQRQTWGDFGAGNFGTGAAIGVKSLFADKEGNFADSGAETVASLMGGVAQNMGDVLGGMDRAGDWAAKAANMAGAMAEAQNGQARNAVMKQAAGQADAMNAQNAAQTAGMTDSAIAGMNAYEGGMGAIGMSGIEGSENMERNLEYGKSRAEAESQMQYDMMGKEAQGLGDAMASSFSDLSQGKAAAMQNAWGGSIAGSNAELTAGYRQTGAEVMANQTTPNDAEKLEADAALADAEAGTAPDGEPQAEAAQAAPKTQAEARQMEAPAAAAQAAAPQAAPKTQAEARQMEAPAAAAPAQAPQSAEPQQSPNAYAELESFLARDIKGSGSLEDKMRELGVPQEKWAAIQAGTVKNPGEDRYQWRKRLEEALR
jgi:hypothetical protein